MRGGTRGLSVKDCHPDILVSSCAHVRLYICLLCVFLAMGRAAVIMGVLS